MRKLAIRILMILLVSAVFTACGSGDKDISEEGMRTASEQLLPNLLIEVDGSIEIRRTGWRDFLPAAFGTVLHQGDLVRLAVGGEALIFCGDEAAWETGPVSLPADGEVHGVPCQSARPPRPWPDVAALRGVEDENAGYIVRPRDTALLNDRPEIVWESADENDGILTLTSLNSDDEEGRETAQVSSGEMNWPESWAPLMFGETYVILIGEETTAPETILGRGFWLLEEDLASEVRDLEDTLRNQSISSDAERLIIAELYASYGLYAEAIEELEPLAIATSAPQVWLKLGQLYLETGLVTEAGDAFTQALDLAVAMGDLTSTGEAHLGIAIVAVLDNDRARDDYHLEQANAVFEMIGDAQLLAEVERLQDP